MVAPGVLGAEEPGRHRRLERAQGVVDAGEALGEDERALLPEDGGGDHQPLRLGRARRHPGEHLGADRPWRGERGVPVGAPQPLERVLLEQGAQVQRAGAGVLAQLLGERHRDDVLGDRGGELAQLGQGQPAQPQRRAALAVGELEQARGQVEGPVLAHRDQGEDAVGLEPAHREEQRQNREKDKCGQDQEGREEHLSTIA